MSIEYINDSILNTDCKFIAHGVNCQGVMGSGVAKVLYSKWPEVKSEYLKYCKDMIPEILLGNVQQVFIDDIIIFNCFTQQNYGRDGQIYLSYNALNTALNTLKYILPIEVEKPSLAIPKIGCGLAGGDWDVVEAIIDDVLSKSVNVKVYYL